MHETVQILDLLSYAQVLRLFIMATLMSNWQRRRQERTYVHACMYWNKNAAPELILAHLNIADFSPQTKISQIRKRTQSCHLSAGSCVTAWPPICCWLFEAKQCSLWRKGEMRGADGHTIHFLKQTQKLLSLGLDSGRWDGVSWEEHPFSTCHLWAKEKSKVDLQKNWK